MADTRGAPKYRSISAVLRSRIERGDYAPGQRLPSQQELASSFNVTLMTLRQALASLEAEGLLRAERGRGTFVADRPVDVSVGNLSSFADQMAHDGVDVVTEVVGVAEVTEGPAVVHAALACDGPLRSLRRRRLVEGTPISLQTSWFDASIDVGVGVDVGASLYAAIEAVTGRAVAEAREQLAAVALGMDDAASLDAEPGEPAIRSIRTSFDQFGRPFLHDDALLLGRRCTIAAHRTSDRLDLRYGLAGEPRPF